MCVYIYIYSVCIIIVYTYIYIWSPHFSLLMCCSFCMFYYGCVHDAQWKCILKGHKETSQCRVCVLFSCLEFERNFSYNKKEVSGSLDKCEQWLAFISSSRYISTNKFTDFSSTHVYSSLLLSVCNTQFECFNCWNILSNICKSKLYRRFFYFILLYKEGQTIWHSRSSFHR